MKIIYSKQKMKAITLVNLIIIILFSIGNRGVNIGYSLSIGILPLIATCILIPSVHRGSFNLINILGLTFITVFSGILNLIIDPSNIGTYYMLIVIYYIEFFFFSDFTIEPTDFKFNRFIPNIVKFRDVNRDDRKLVIKLSKFNHCNELIETIKLYGSRGQSENIYSLIMVLESENAKDLRMEIEEACNTINENIKKSHLEDEDEIKVNRDILKMIK